MGFESPYTPEVRADAVEGYTWCLAMVRRAFPLRNVATDDPELRQFDRWMIRSNTRTARRCLLDIATCDAIAARKRMNARKAKTNRQAVAC